MAGCVSTASSRSENLPSTCGRIASRSKAPHSARTGPLSAETQKWFDQNQVKRSPKPVSALSAAS